MTESKCERESGMSATLENLSNAVGNEASDELDGALQKIKHCVDRLVFCQFLIYGFAFLFEERLNNAYDNV